MFHVEQLRESADEVKTFLKGKEVSALAI